MFIIRKLTCLIPLILSTIIAFSQADTFSILKTAKPGFSIISPQPQQVSVVFAKHSDFRIDEPSDSIVKTVQTFHYSNFVSSPFISFPDNYTRFYNNTMYYNDRNEIIYTKPETNPNFNPTNPWNTNKITDVLVMGSLNTVFSLINR